MINEQYYLTDAELKEKIYRAWVPMWNGKGIDGISWDCYIVMWNGRVEPYDWPKFLRDGGSLYFVYNYTRILELAKKEYIKGML